MIIIVKREVFKAVVFQHISQEKLYKLPGVHFTKDHQISDITRYKVGFKTTVHEQDIFIYLDILFHTSISRTAETDLFQY